MKFTYQIFTGIHSSKPPYSGKATRMYTPKFEHYFCEESSLGIVLTVYPNKFLRNIDEAHCQTQSDWFQEHNFNYYLGIKTVYI